MQLDVLRHVPHQRQRGELGSAGLPGADHEQYSCARLHVARLSQHECATELAHLRVIRGRADTVGMAAMTLVQLRDVLLKRQWRTIVAVFAAAFLAGLLVIALLPEEYEAT